MNICKEFGDRVRQLRVAQGLSQEVLAQKSGLHRTYIGSVERGERNISLENIQKITRALRITIADIMSKPSPIDDINQ
ncbi:MAG: helix-turn-helix transcriptional regulator [Lentisphaeria bacterium]|nr:helix-turn-helix transcriptional regulator [Lentisphaeria bacterium]